MQQEAMLHMKSMASQVHYSMQRAIHMMIQKVITKAMQQPVEQVSNHDDFRPLGTERHTSLLSSERIPLMSAAMLGQLMTTAAKQTNAFLHPFVMLSLILIVSG